jgi:hypothetical protein
MKDGFGIVEAVLALFLLMLCAVCVFRANQACVLSASYGESLCRAGVLGSEALSTLRVLQLDAPELEPGWHKDPENPIREKGGAFFRFWSVEKTPTGKKATVYVAWADRSRGNAGDFNSGEEISASNCPRVVLSELFVALE